MSIVKTIGRGMAWSTAGTVLGKIVVFANMFVILRYLSLYDYGLAQLVLSVVSMLSILLLPGLSSTVVADLATERGRREFGRLKAIFMQFSSLTIGLSVIAWAVLFFAADIAAHLAGNDTIGYLLKIASFTLLATPLRAISTMLASTELRYADQSLYGIVEEVAKLLSLLACFFVFNMGLAGLLYSIVISQFAAILVFAPRSYSAYRVFASARAEDLFHFWEIIREHRKWGIVTSYVSTLGKALQLWIIRLMLGTEAVGLYSFAEGIVGQVASFLPLGGVLAPLLPRYVDNRADFARYVRSAVKAHILFALGLIVCTFVGLPVLLVIFPKYQPSALLVIVLIWSVIPASVVSIYTPAFVALKEQYGYLLSIAVKIFFMGLFTTLGIMAWGVPGIGAGAVLASLASTLERTWRLKRTLPEFTVTVRDVLTFDAYERTLFNTMWERWYGMLSLLRR